MLKSMLSCAPAGVLLMDYYNNVKVISLYLVKFNIFNLCVSATSININKNIYQHVCTCVTGVLFVDS